MEKIFRVMQDTNVEEVNFAAYQLKDVVYLLYEERDMVRSDAKELSLLEAFSNAFLDRFFPQDLRKEKMKEFVNLK